MTYETERSNQDSLSSSLASQSSHQNLPQQQHHHHHQQEQQKLSKRKRIQKVIEITVLTIMNAAVTIFGVGVGVGLILGDSIRGREQIGSVTVTTTTSNTHHTTYDNERGEEDDRRDSGRSQMFSNTNLLPAQ